MNLIVSKFGGTSMQDAQRMLGSALVATKQGASIVVVSATSGTTNDLIKVTQFSQNGEWEKALELIHHIRNRHIQIATDLKTSTEEVEALLTELESIAKGIYLLRDCSSKAKDLVMSMGERVSSLLFVKAMQDALQKSNSLKKVMWLDAREIIKTDDQFGRATPLTETILQTAQAQLIPRLNQVDEKQKVIYVTQGFIGATLDGFTTTLGRGGSDYSAAIFAEAIGADVLEIWTDVPGIATTDPRICKQAKPIQEISFTEASELATFGAKVLHPATLLPAVRQNIPVFVGSSFEPNLTGTWIRKEVSSAPLVRAMAIRKKQILITLTTPAMLQTHGFLSRIFKVFNDNQVSVDAITTSEISVAMTLDDSTLLNKKLIEDLKQIAEVQIETNLTLVSLIGNRINHTPGLAKQVFETIPDINVRMICLGASRHNFCFIVEEAFAEDTIRKLHSKFI